MAQSSDHIHEQGLRPETIDQHRALVSLEEELEAVDWYAQRAEAATDAELAEIIRHNRDDEKEHFAMLLEWLRRHDPALDEQLRLYLFTTGPVTSPEDTGGGANGADASLGIGALGDKAML